MDLFNITGTDNYKDRNLLCIHGPPLSESLKSDLRLTREKFRIKLTRDENIKLTIKQSSKYDWKQLLQIKESLKVV